jgi:diguanylate cyclase (GGDEF)-like protein
MNIEGVWHIARFSWPGRFRPEPLSIQAATVLIGGAIIIAIAITTYVLTRQGLEAADRYLEAGAAAAEIESAADQLRSARLDLLQAGNQPSDAGNPVLIAIESSRLVEQATAKDGEFRRLLPAHETSLTHTAVASLRAGFDSYVQSPTQEHYATFTSVVAVVQAITDERSAEIRGRAMRYHDQVAVLLSSALVANIVVVVAVTVVVGATGLTTGRKLKSALREAEGEKADLRIAKQSVERRNTQLAALYQIVTEVAESLNLNYVVTTTVRETRKLLGADAVILRLVEDGQLVVAGFDADDSSDLRALSPLALGEGVVGRAAKRGKTILVSENVAEHVSDAEQIPEMATALVVPLIVGAKVVGALACWARVAGTFNEDDQLVLELMATQVATAVAAANVYAASEDAAHHDPLTTLPNRRQLVDDLRTDIAALIRDRRPLVVAMLDIDHFKQLNDEYGHRVGDVTLQRVAQTIRSSLRQEDRVYRYGGEEFVAIMPNADMEHGRQLAERLREQIAQLLLTGENLETVGPVTVSIGLASFPADGEDMGTLIRLADEAMYEAKENGRNQTRVHGAPAKTTQPKPRKAA